MKLRLGLASTLTALVGFSTLAIAQPAPSDPPPPPEAPPGDPLPPPPPGTPPPGAPMGAPAMMPPPGQVVAPDKHAGVDKGVMDDAASSSSFFTPTALTAPAGTFWFSDVDLLLVTIGYAITNELQVSATGLVPLTSDFPLWVVLNGKYQFFHSGRLRLALQGALLIFGLSEDDTTVVNGNATSTSSTNYFFAGDVGGAGTLCFDDSCSSHGSLFVGAGFAADSDQKSVPLAVGASIVGKVSKHVRVIGEVDTGYVVGKINDTSDAFLVSYGLRFTSRNVGVDFGFSKVLAAGYSDPLLLGIPYLGFTYRGIED